MKEKTILAKKEARHHGSVGFPLAYYRVDSSRLTPGTEFLVKHHWHDEVELVYFENGAFQAEINMERFFVEGPCFCFLNRQELHYLESRRDFVESAVVFLPQMLLFGAEDAVQRRYLAPLCEGGLLFPRFLRGGEPGFEAVKSAYQRIADCFLNREVNVGEEDISKNANPKLPVFARMRIKGALLEILSVLGEQGLFLQELPVFDRRVETVKSALSYMKEHAGEKLYVRQLAQQANMNEQYFCRFFKSVIGKSPMAYLNDIRIRQAAELLKESDRSVTEVCLEAGFHNLGNFMRVFREAYGCTPLQFRKINRI